jgi:hypothetical protein
LAGEGGRVLQQLTSVVAAASVVSSLVGATAAWADGAEVIATGPALIPVASSEVQLVMEEVHVSLPVPGGTGGHVEVKYHLKNPAADTVALSMAFVTGEDTRGGLLGSGQLRDSHFRVVLYSTNEELETRREAINADDWSPLVDDPPESLDVWELVMPPGERELLMISYDTWPRWFEDAGRIRYDFTYHARPASLWAGRLMVASVFFTLGDLGGPLLKCLLTESDCVTARITPEGYVWTEYGLKWGFKDWEPDTDFTVSLFVDDTAAFRGW